MKLTKHITKKGSLICLFFIGLLSCNTTEQPQVHQLSGGALGTIYHITYLGDEQPDMLAQIDSLTPVFNYALSTYDPNSLITAYNTNQPIHKDSLGVGSDHFVTMIDLAREITIKTHGAFDASAGALFRVYDRAKKAGAPIDSTEVSPLLVRKGYPSLKYDSDGWLIKDSTSEYNFNAIAKGYFVDLICELFEASGTLSYMVEVGGEVRTKGTNSKGEPWRIGINKPQIGASQTDYFQVLELTGQSMATSGNYQNYYVVDGNVVGHTMDPRTGFPIVSDLKSATVIHRSCAVADAYATACMVLGLDESSKLIESDSSLQAYFIFEENGDLKGVHVK